MNDDSSSAVVASRIEGLIQSIEGLIQSMPPGSRLPSYRQLQRRYRLSPATVQRMLADLGRRGLVVTRPGSGTFTAAARRTAAPALDVAWQTLALGPRSGLGSALERLIEPPPPAALPLPRRLL